MKGRGKIVKLRAIVVGPGYMGRHHLAAYASHEGAEVVCVVPRSRETATRVGRELDLPTRLDLDEALQHFAPDVVSVCSPTAHHAEHAITALRRGVNVLVEKPFASTVEEGRAVVEAARRAHRIVMPAHTTLFEPGLKALVKLVDRGFLGTIRSARFVRQGRDVSPGEVEKGRGPETDPALDGGPDESLYDHLVHVTYVLNKLAGSTPRQLAVGEREARRWHERLKAQVTYKNDVRVELDLSSRAEDAFGKRWQVLGDKGEAVSELRDGETSLRWRPTGGAWEPIAPAGKSGFEAVVHHFIDAVHANRYPAQTGEDGLRAMALAAGLAGGFPSGS